MNKAIEEMTVSELESELDWMERYFAECATSGDGISTKETVRHRAMITELLKRGVIYQSLELY
jgi:hypothetical protein